MALTVIAQEFTTFRPLQEGGGFLVLYTFLVLFLLKGTTGVKFGCSS